MKHERMGQIVAGKSAREVRANPDHKLRVSAHHRIVKRLSKRDVRKKTSAISRIPERLFVHHRLEDASSAQRSTGLQ